MISSFVTITKMEENMQSLGALDPFIFFLVSLSSHQTPLLHAKHKKRRMFFFLVICWHVVDDLVNTFTEKQKFWLLCISKVNECVCTLFSQVRTELVPASGSQLGNEMKVLSEGY